MGTLDSFTLQDKVVVVTGAGEALAELLPLMHLNAVRDWLSGVVQRVSWKL